MMQKILLFCGLPRSGTTFAYRSVVHALRLDLDCVEETHFMMDARLVENLANAMRDIYRGSLIETYEGLEPYSAWGSEKAFVSTIMAAMPAVINAACKRFYIESDTASKFYLNEFDAFLNTDIRHFFSRVISYKKPSIEMNWRAFEAVFSKAIIRYIICFRDPYKVYTSLNEVGWIESFDDFIERATQSYQATRELLERDMAILFRLDNGAPALQSLIERVAEFAELPITDTDDATIDLYWQNAVSKRKPINITRDEFQILFRDSKAWADYEAIGRFQ